MQENEFDIAIVGSGFAASIFAMIARRLGHSVVLLEKGRHPKFAIGESSTPIANLLIEEIAARYDLPRLAPLSKWGTWQEAYPEIGCGLKRGFSFYHHEAGQNFAPRASHSNELLVAASPHDGIADTHWYRPDFDHFLVREAQNLGAKYLDELTLGTPEWRTDEAVLAGSRNGEAIKIRARFVFDATGPRGFLHRALGLGEREFSALPQTQALYTHFTSVRRWEEVVPTPAHQPPYPVDDAALHHVFDGGWMWVLRFANGITSAGVAATDEIARELRFEEGAAAWERLMERLPTVAAQFQEARPLLPFVHARRLSFCSSQIAGERWALLPSAAGFVDPLLSTGFPLSLLGVSRLAEAIERGWGQPSFQLALRDYAAQTHGDLMAAQSLIGALYANMDDFEVFMALSKLYFAAASFSETARRLGRPQLAGSFLLREDNRFGPALAEICQRARQPMAPHERAALIEQIYRAIEPFDVAGLSNARDKRWYPVDAADLMDARARVGASRADIEALLERAGFYAPSTPTA